MVNPEDLRSLSGGRLAFPCPHCQAQLAMPDTRPISGPCPLCGGLIAIPAAPLPELEPLPLPSPITPEVRSVKSGKTDSIPVGSLRLGRSESSADGERRPQRQRQRRRESAFAPGYFLLSLGLLVLLGCGIWWLSVPIRGWLEESPWTREFFRRTLPADLPESVETGPGTIEALPISAAEEGAWGALKAFLKSDARARAAMTLEGDSEMEAPFVRLFGPEGVLKDGLPEVSRFQISSDRELSAILGPDWSIYRAEGEPDGRAAGLVLAWTRTPEGKFRLAGRLFLELAEGRLAAFAEPGGDPSSQREFLARLRGRALADRRFAADPLAPEVELLPPMGDEVIGLITLPENDPILRSLSGDSIAPATVRLGRISGEKGGVKLLSAPTYGWPGGLTASVPQSTGEWEQELARSPAIEVARRFLAAKSERRLDYVNTRDNAMLLKELEDAIGGPPDASSPLQTIEAMPLTALRAGAVALRVRAPTQDTEGVCVLWLVPFAGSHKIEGSLWAQSYYGWFRRFLKAPVSSPRELRGVVFPLPSQTHSASQFRFRDVHSEAAVELSLPPGSPQAASLAKIPQGQARHATLRLRWENDASPRIVLDEWLCWGYRGIDEQSF